jgi:ligand-binding sensor domain-containing protein/signal transduction histidine kinase
LPGSKLCIERNPEPVQNKKSHMPPLLLISRLVLPVKILVWLTCCALVVRAEKLPTRIYTIADGLSRDMVNCIEQDSRGFIWFCTAEGLSRFDGYEFKNYPKEHGLPNRYIYDFLETRRGRIWIGTANGLVLFDPRGQPAGSPNAENSPMFTTYRLPVEEKGDQIISEIYEDRDGIVWLGSNYGLFRLTEENDQTKIDYIELGESPYAKLHYISSLNQDTNGDLWICSNNFLFRRKTDGRLERYGKENGFAPGEVNDPSTKYPFTSLLIDKEGRYWASTAFGLAKLVKDPQPGQNIVERLYTQKDGLVTNNIMGLFLSKDQKIWVLTPLEISKYLPESDTFRSYTKDHGLAENGGVTSMLEDQEGNLWVGQNGGAVKIARSGFTSFRQTDGITHLPASIFENKAGRIYALSDHLGEGKEAIFRFDENKFTGVRIKALQNLKNWGWGVHKIAFEDSRGEWWFPTGVGLYRFPKVEKIEDLANLPPKYIYTKKDGLGNDEIFRLFEDSRGDIWISSLYQSPALNRWVRATDQIETYSFENDTNYGTPMSYAEDKQGNIWMGSYVGRLIRYKDGKFSLFFKEDGLPDGALRSLYVDQKGRLWGATMQGGVFRIDDTSAEHPTFVNLTAADGLSSNVVVAITEDLQGRMYFATGRGVDRYEPETGRIKHFTTNDGLASNHFTDAARDQNGNLWFATANGLSRLTPENEAPVAPPPIFVSKIRIADENYPISELGETEISNLELLPERNQLEASFVSPNFSGSENLRYQYKLEGSDTDWKEPTRQRTLTFASLSPGSYRFVVRAINAEGMASQQPAVISFRVLRPFWQRWWFLTILAMLAGLVIYIVYRYRLKRLLELERIRTRIATDLHDDIGSSLSQIAILSEVVRQKVGDNGANKPLNLIADTSRELVDSMSDIVWAINPNKDSVSDLIKRMRRFAGDVLDAKDIGYSFRVPEKISEIPLGADIRREVYLMFKECVNNLAKHSAATAADISISVDSNELIVSITDNGRGFHVPSFDVHVTHEGFGGNGLLNLKKRAENLGGRFQIRSEMGQGTDVSFEIPVPDKRWIKLG